MRPPGMDDEVSIASGGNCSYEYWNKEFLGFVGAPPQFAEPIETVRARIVETVDHVTVPHKVRTWHPAIDRLLKEDEKRREKQLTDPIRRHGTNLCSTQRLNAVGCASDDPNRDIQGKQGPRDYLTVQLFGISLRV